LLNTGRNHYGNHLIQLLEPIRAIFNKMSTNIILWAFYKLWCYVPDLSSDAF